jgi:glutamyl aminopeptidase
MDYKECVDLMAEKFHEWLRSTDRETNRPSPDIRGLVYNGGMRSEKTTEEDWNTMLKLFVNETDAVEKAKLQTSLTTYRDPLVLKRLIDLASDDTIIRGQDYFNLMGQIAANRNGEALVWDYVRENWPKLVARFGLGERYLGRMIPSITSKFTTQTKLEEMEQFFKKYPDAGAGANARIQALEAVRNNIKFLERHLEPIGKWLQEQK